MRFLKSWQVGAIEQHETGYIPSYHDGVKTEIILYNLVDMFKAGSITLSNGLRPEAFKKPSEQCRKE